MLDCANAPAEIESRKADTKPSRETARPNVISITSVISPVIITVLVSKRNREENEEKVTSLVAFGAYPPTRFQREAERETGGNVAAGLKFLIADKASRSREEEAQ